jgi:hypothetical protein
MLFFIIIIYDISLKIYKKKIKFELLLTKLKIFLDKFYYYLYYTTNHTWMSNYSIIY